MQWVHRAINAIKKYPMHAGTNCVFLCYFVGLFVCFFVISANHWSSRVALFWPESLRTASYIESTMNLHAIYNLHIKPHDHIQMNVDNIQHNLLPLCIAQFLWFDWQFYWCAVRGFQCTQTNWGFKAFPTVYRIKWHYSVKYGQESISQKIDTQSLPPNQIWLTSLNGML